jgi:hypothetical protein
MTSTTPTPASGEEPLSYETSVVEAEDGQFEVVIDTVHEDGARRQHVGKHATVEMANKAASLIDRSAKRYEGAGSTDPGAPTFADPATS